MPRLKIIHSGDGLSVASFITSKLTGNPSYNMKVDLVHLKPVTSSANSASSESCDDDSVTISVLLVTPSMMAHLNSIKGDERTTLIEMLRSKQEPVYLSCFVPDSEVTDQIIATFEDLDFQWRHIEIRPTRRSFHQCVVELLTMVEETMGDLPIPTLKRFHLLPDKTVLAGDTIYILLEKSLTEEEPIQTLNVNFKDSSQVTANQITDCLYQFEVPESLESSRRIEVFISEGESIGEDVIRYKDKLQIFADILREIISPIETLCQSLEAEISQEKMDPVITDWLKFGKNGSSIDDIKTLLCRWLRSLQSDHTSSESIYQELPLFLYLCAKHNPHMFSQTLMQHLTTDKGMTQRKGKVSQQRSPSESEKSGQSELAVEKNGQAQLEAEMEDNEDASYEAVSELFTPGYCTPDDIFIETKSGKQCIYVAYENVKQRKTSSAIIPGNENHRLEKEKLCKSCPPVCSTHGHARENCSEPCYSNIACQQSDTSMCSVGNISNLQCTEEMQDQVPGRRSTSISEELIEHLPCMNSATALNLEEPNSSNSESCRIPPKSPLEIPSTNKNDNSSRPPYSERPATPVLPKQKLKLSLVTNINIQEESDEDIKPQLPPRPNSDSSKPNATTNSKRSRRLSLASPVSPSAPPLNNIHANSLSLPRPPKARSNIQGQSKVELCIPPALPYRSPETALNTSRNKAPPIPYSCRPSPPIPKNVQKDEHSYSFKPNSGIFSQRSRSMMKLNTEFISRPMRSSVSESSQNSQNCADDQDMDETSPDLPPDYSHPLNLYFQDGCLALKSSEDQSELDEVIYDMVDEFLQSSVKAEEDVIYDVPRKTPHPNELKLLQKTSSESQQPQSLPTSVAPQSPVTPVNGNAHHKKSSKTSPIWSSLSSKLSLRKPGKSRKHVTKL